MKFMLAFYGYINWILLIVFPGLSVYGACSGKSLGKFVPAAAKVSFSLNFIEFTCALLLLYVKIITVMSITTFISVKSRFLLVLKILFANTCARILPVTY